MLVLLLFTHYVDLVAESLVLRLELVQIFVVLVKLILENFNLGGVLLDLCSGWPLFLEMLLLLIQFSQSLLVGVLQDHESLLLMFEFSGEVVSLSLESGDLTLVHSSAHSGLI